jgi:AraC family transcriptional regulator of adaptative response / DNA-3-methyladenine glycosylase II
VKSARAARSIRRLRYTPPYDWPAILAFFRARAIEGVEEVDDEVYRRFVAIGRQLGTVEIRHEPARHSLVMTAHCLSRPAVESLRARARRVCDTAADLPAIHAHLSRDTALAPFVAGRPGLRVPGGWSGFEVAVRAILGQQITVVAARQLAGRLVALCGDALPPTRRSASSLCHAFPSPTRMLDANLDTIGMPSARRSALKALAETAATNPRLFDPSSTLNRTIARLRAMRGVGEWTAQYIAMRASREPDAFPATDIGLLRGAAVIFGAMPTPDELLRHAETWRPWRAHAAQHLWAIDAAAARPNRGDT